MFEKVLVVAVAVLVVILAVRLLRLTGGLSLLAWEALVLSATFTLGVWFIELINTESPLAVARTDSVIISRFAIGVLLANLVALGGLLGLRRFVKQIPPVAPSTDRSNERREDTPAMYWLGILVVMIGLIVYLASDRVDLVLSSGAQGLGDYNAYYDLRYELSQLSTSTLEQYLFVIPLGTILPLLTLYSLYRYRTSRRSTWLIRWLVLAATWLIVSILYYAKQPVLVVVLSNAVLLILTDRSQKQGARWLSWRWLFIGGAGMLLAAFLMYRVLGAADDLATSVQLLGERFLVIPALTAYNHMYIFPDYSPHTLYQGSTLQNLLLAGGQTSITGSMSAFYVVSEILTGRAYNMNTGPIGEGWAAMGYVGVVQQTIIILGLFLLWDRWLLSHQRQGALIILAAFFLGRFDNIQNIGLMGMLVQGGLVAAPVFVLLLMARDVSAVAPITSRSPAVHRGQV